MKFRRLFPVFVIALLFLVAPVWHEVYAENLLMNADFSELDDEGMPEYWYTDAYTQEEGFTSYQVVDGNQEYPHAVMIQNISSNDARFAQTVPVDPDSYYILSGYIYTEGIREGHGANLSFGDVYVFDNPQYKPLYDTEGQWKYVEYYGRTGPVQEAVDVFVRLGGYSGESTGRALFTGLSLKKTDSVPSDILPVPMYRESETYEDSDDQEYDTADDAEGSFRMGFFLIAIIYAAAAYIMLKYVKGHGERILNQDNWDKFFAAAVILLGFLLRVLISLRVEGYMVDVNCFISWGHTMASVGPAQFYQATNFCDYPPLYTYVLALNSMMTNVLGGGEAATRIVFRFIPSICDLAGCFMVYRMLLEQKNTSRKSIMIFLMFAVFNPATILNSAAWGQMDSVLCLILLAVSLCAVKNNWKTALPLYMTAVLIKPQALMLGPLGLTYIVFTYIRKPEFRKSILTGTGISLLVLAAGVIPFSINQKWDWLIQLYFRTLASYPHATVNTANFYYLLGGNWSAVGNEAHILAPVFLSGLCLLYGFLWHKHAKLFEKRYIETTVSMIFSAAFIICAVIRASWAWIGGMAMVYAFSIVISHAVRSGKISLLPWLGGLLFILLYVFGVKMHERYIFPALLLLAASWIILRDRRILYILILFTFTVFMNEGIVLDNSIRLGSGMGHLNNDTVMIADILSMLNIAGVIYAVWVSTEILFGKEQKKREIILSGKYNPLKWKCDRKLHWTKKDTFLLILVTAVYTVISLLTLGSTKAPQTYWSASSDDEQIVFDLGKTYKDFEILYFGQVSKHDFSFSESPDGLQWEEEVWAQMDEGQCWKWKYVTDSYIKENSKRENKREFRDSGEYYIIHFSGRYIRLSAKRLGLKLNEILFRENDGTPIPAKVLSRTGGETDSVLYSDPSALLDEQDSMEGLPSIIAPDYTEEGKIQPSWWNSTYFDEIYHARTAHEFLRGSVPYETSHPPLGKVIMSLFVAIFGMTPFGWRFAGALAGIAMLPGMYLIGKQLTKKTGIAVFTCLMMALDCMHLTQTQIATIDSFPVLFIIFSYFFMLRFIQTDFMKEKLSKTLVNLGLSGLFMGLSIASKWIGIYAGAGLAVLFFWHCIRTAVHGKEAEKIIRNETVPGTKHGSEGRRRNDSDRKAEYAALNETVSEYGFRPVLNRTVILCAWCVLFFIFIPIVIYLLSYIPYMAHKAGRIQSLSMYIAEVWQTQIHMFNYHSEPGLGMDHPFYSPWWQWPVIGKPMYYAANQYLPDDSPVFHSIFAFGNPVIWFGAIAAYFICIIRLFAPVNYSTKEDGTVRMVRERTYDPRYVFILIGLLAQYLPWVLVPRGTYIYHYFASLPFLMASIGLCFDSGNPKLFKILRTAAVLFAIAAAVFFILLFPYASGMNTSPEWLNVGKNILRIWY